MNNVEIEAVAWISGSSHREIREDPWRNEALCAGRDQALWFGRGARYGKAICVRCPVNSKCLGVAILEEGNERAGERHGVRYASPRRRRDLWLEYVGAQEAEEHPGTCGSDLD
jgi:hypothetical protein